AGAGGGFFPGPAAAAGAGPFVQARAGFSARGSPGWWLGREAEADFGSLVELLLRGLSSP
ncbi:TetR/AcrR family transcriptional regulator, partial [Streptomyces sp. NPDC059627]